MTTITVVVQDQQFIIRLPENMKDLRKLCKDDYSAQRMLQLGAHQRQLSSIRSLLLGGYSRERVQELMNHYRYSAHQVGGSVEQAFND